jgi:predicted alpha/beta superfamily hydrolase
MKTEKIKEKIFGSQLMNLVVTLFVLSLAGSLLLAQDNKTEQSIPEVKLSGTQQRDIYSKVVGQDYELYINLPADYNNTEKSYPVIYLLDAQWDFALLNAIYGQQYFDGFIPEIVTVGITWGGKNPNADNLRARDFTPTSIKGPIPTGNAANFLKFIKEELIPFIEKNYRVTNDRTIMGSSLGGLFTLYALFNETDLFNKYVLTSPALGWDNGSLYSYEKNFKERESGPPIRLFMAIGGLEHQADFQKLADHLKSMNYKNLEIGTKVIEGIGHSGGKADGYTRGLQFAFERPSLSLSSDILDQYVGTYQPNDQVKIKVTKKDGHLEAEATGQGKVELLAESESDFYAKGVFLNVHFKKDENNKVTGIQLEQYTGGAFIKKVD